MNPAVDGYYLSDQMHSEDWHAGVKITDDYFRFFRFFSDGFWLWCDHRSRYLDFSTFVREFDLPRWREGHMRLSPPTSSERDGGHLFQFGTYRVKGAEITASFHCPIAGITFHNQLSILEDGRTLCGWGHLFIFQPDSCT